VTLPVHVGKTVVVVHNMDTGVKTAVQTGFDMERTGVASEKEQIALQAQMVAHLTPKRLWDFTAPAANPSSSLSSPQSLSLKPEPSSGLIGFSAQLVEMRFLLIAQLMKFTQVVAHFMPAFVAL